MTTGSQGRWHTIAWKFNFVLLGALIAAFVLAAVVTAYLGYLAALQVRAAEENRVFETYKTAVAQPLWDCDPETTRGIMQALGDVPQVASAALQDICADVYHFAGASPSDPEQILAAGETRPVQLVDGRGRAHDVGALTIAFERNTPWQMIQSEIEGQIAVLGILLLVVLVVATGANRTIVTGPIHRFQRAIAGHSFGDTLDLPDLKARKDELGDLVRGYDDLMGQLNTQYATSQRLLLNLNESMNYAARLQGAMLEREAATLPAHVDLSIKLEQLAQVGGDFYVVRKTNAGTLIVVADCTGHSIPGAMGTFLAISVLDRLLDTGLTDPAQIAHGMHRTIQHALKQDRPESVTSDGLEGAFMLIPHNSLDIVYCGARFPILVRRGGTIDVFKSSKTAIGHKDGKAPQAFSNQTIAMHDGGYVYLVTDGMLEQLGGPKRRMLGTKRFQAMVEALPPGSAHAQVEALMDGVEAYRGEERRADDRTIAVVKLSPPSAAAH